MKIIGSDKPEFFTHAAVIRKYLPRVDILSGCKIICIENRYYGLITVQSGAVIYDHIILDKMACNPEIIFIVMSTLFSFGDIVNVFIELDNDKSWRFVQGIGFTNTGILRQTPKSLAIWSMTVGEWKNNRIMRHFTEKQHA